ncbi:MAG: hypothetical protein HOP29_09225 [Phycisphaerales bacterium]|nr:hypothetical protein [Phycisphaerales bacterium]
MKTNGLAWRVVMLLIVVAAVFTVSAVHAKGGFTACPISGIECPQIYNPVICQGGVIYPNMCEAKKVCAKNCVYY